MQQIEEIGTYLKGVWLLVTGDSKGIEWLDLSANGVLRSFLAFAWCLPAMAVSWAAWRMYYLANMPDGTPAGLGFMVKLLLVDIAAWMIPLVLIAVLARPLGYLEILADVIVASNWLSVPVFYALAVPAAIRLVIPGSAGLTAMLSLIALLVAFTAIFRLLKTIVGDHWLLATTLSLLFVLPSMMAAELLQGYLGLVPVLDN